MAEHLIAIAMAANRLKDQPWILRLIEHEAVDDGMLQCILKTHGLTARWEEFDQIYGGRIVTKPEMRKRLAALSFSHKIEILEKLRDRSLAFAKARREHKQ